MSGKVGHVPNTIVTHYVPNDPQHGSSEQEDVFGNPVYSPDYHSVSSHLILVCLLHWECLPHVIIHLTGICLQDSPREGGMRRPMQTAPAERIQKEMAGRKGEFRYF